MAAPLAPKKVQGALAGWIRKRFGNKRPARADQYNEPMAFLWTLMWVDPLIILSTIFFGSISVAFALFDKSGRKMMLTARVWARSLVRIAGVRVKVEGLNKIDPNAAYVFAANHLSYMDTPV